MKTELGNWWLERFAGSGTPTIRPATGDVHPWLVQGWWVSPHKEKGNSSGSTLEPCGAQGSKCKASNQARIPCKLGRHAVPGMVSA